MTFKQIQEYSKIILNIKNELKNLDDNKFSSIKTAITEDETNRKDLLEICDIIDSYGDEHARLAGYSKIKYTQSLNNYDILDFTTLDINEVVDGAFLKNGNLFFHTTPDWNDLNSKDPNPNESPNNHILYDSWRENESIYAYSPTEITVINNLQTAISGGLLNTIEPNVVILINYLNGEKNILLKNTRRTTVDNTALEKIETLLAYLISWQTNTRRGTTPVLNALNTTLNTRKTYITTRVSEIVNYMTIGLGKNLYVERNNIIKVRINKQFGTLNKIYRFVLSNGIEDNYRNTKQIALNKYIDKLVVKRILIDGDGGFFVTIEKENDTIENTYSINISDKIYIVGDVEGTIQESFIVKGKTQYKVSNGIDQNGNKVYIDTYKLFLNKKASKNYLTENNIRVVKRRDI